MSKVIIDIPDNMDLQNYDVPYVILNIITNGIQLPKGHGRLIDADELLSKTRTVDIYSNRYGGVFSSDVICDYDVWNAPTIVEADKEVSI